MVELDHLTFSYDGNREVLSDISFHLKAGETVGLIGANGAGKSTLLKTAAGQLPAVSGTVCIDGREIGAISVKERAKKLALLMTERISPELMTCEDVVELGRYPYTGQLGVLSDNDREKIAEAMEITNSKELSDSLFSRVSDGQRQRVMLARAICQEPEILILDEPASYLDIRYKIELLSILKRLASEKNITVIMSLHELDMARKISDRVVCVKDGKVHQIGTPNEIFGGDCIAELYGIDPTAYGEYLGV